MPFDCGRLTPVGLCSMASSGGTANRSGGLLDRRTRGRCRKARLDPGALCFEGRDHVVVHELDGGHREFVGIEPGLGVAGVAVDRGLQVDPCRTPLRNPTKKVSTATRALVWGASMW